MQPEFYNNKLCITTTDFISEFGLTTYKNMLRRNEGLEKFGYGGNGRTVYLVIDSLPPAKRKEIYAKCEEDPNKVAARKPFIERIEKDEKAVEFFASYEYKVFDIIKKLPTTHQEKYSNSAAILNCIKDTIENRRILTFSCGVPKVKLWPTIVENVKYLNSTMPHSLPGSEKRIKITYLKYMKNGYASLIDPKFGNANARVVDFNIELLLNSLFSDKILKPTMADVYDKYFGFIKGGVKVISQETGEYYDPKDYPELSKSTVESYLAKWKNKIGTHTMRSGNRQVLMQKFRPYHSMQQPQFAGSILSIDDRQPPFEYEKGKRLWFYNGIDLASEAFTVWVSGKTKEGIILEFYRQMVRNYAEWGWNLPAELEGEISLNSVYMNTFLQEGCMFQYTHIEANNARGKRIEAYYRPLRYGLEKKREGWLARPFALSESNQAGPGEKKIIPYNEITEGCLRDLETWNNMPHSKHKDKTRWEYQCEMQNKNLRPTNYRAFIPLLGYHTETSCRTGIVHLQNKEFLLGNNGIIATGDTLINLMFQAEGRTLDVYWLDANDGNVLKAYAYIGEQYICELIAKPISHKARIEMTPESEANRELMSKYVATISGFQNRQVKSIEKLMVIDERKQTLNNKFQIKGVSRYDVKETGDVETMEDLPEQDEDLIMVSREFKSSLKDRF